MADPTYVVQEVRDAARGGSAQLTAPAVRPRAILETWTDPNDGLVHYAFTLPGAPRSKKTSNQAVRMGAKCHACGLRKGMVRVFPSQAFRDYQQVVSDYVMTKPQLRLALASPVAVRAVFYRERAVGDLMGYLQGLCDLLQVCGIVLNDRQVASLDGSRLDKDADNPRVVVTLTVLKQDVQEEIEL